MGTDDEAMAARLVACEADPARAHGESSVGAWALADARYRFRWQLVLLRCCVTEPDDDGHSRELYGALVEEYRDQPTQLAALRSVGEALREREARGELPRTLMRRTPRRHSPP